MAKLTTTKPNLPSAEVGLPKLPTAPRPSVKRAKLSPAQATRIRAKANAILGR
jgi:hypothetical protein